jgi:hypothetical protein
MKQSKKSPVNPIQINVLEHYEKRKDGVYQIWDIPSYGLKWEMRTPYDEIPFGITGGFDKKNRF